MPGEISPDSLLGEVTRLLGDSTTRRGAETVAAEIAAMPSPEEVAETLAERYGGGA
jgi:calicheamicin 3'-O-methyl-rhamnosyltransferase